MKRDESTRDRMHPENVPLPTEPRHIPGMLESPKQSECQTHDMTAASTATVLP